MTEQQRTDTRHVLQLGLALVGAAILAGTVVGAAFGMARDVMGALSDSDFDA